jgi:hypothetical protein
MFAVSLSEMEWIAEAMVSNDECEGAPAFSLWTHIRADCSSAREAHALYSRRGQKVERCSSRQFQPRCGLVRQAALRADRSITDGRERAFDGICGP